MNDEQWKQLLTESKKLVISESVNTEADTLVIDIIATIQKYFKNSTLNVSFTVGYMPSINITFYVGRLNDWPNKIADNDVAKNRMSIYGFDKLGNIKPSGLVLELDRGGFVVIKPSDKPDPKLGFKLAQGRVKVPFRKTSGDSTKILKAIDNYFKRLSKTIVDNSKNLMSNHLYALNYVKR